MSHKNYNWSTLIDKYLRKTISADELEELRRQIRQCPLKEKQFNEHTDPKKTLERMRDIYYWNHKAKDAWKEFKGRHPSVQFDL